MSNATINNLLGRAEEEFSIYDPYTPTSNSELGQDEFLSLLIAQLEHQDPLNPMEDKEFTAQMASFSSLEQLTNINEGIGTLNDNAQRQELLSAVSFMGKQVRAEGNSIGINNGEVSTLYYQLTETITDGAINIYDSYGNLVRTVDLGSKQLGEYEYQWDGTDYNGEPLPDGLYYAYMYGDGVNGQAVQIYTDVSGEVAGVQQYGSSMYLRLTDGRVVNFTDIREIVDPSDSQTQEDEAEEETESETESEA